MKILLAVDGSRHSDRAEAALRRFLGGSPQEVEVFYVTPEVMGPGKGESVSLTEALKSSGQEMVATVVGEVKKHRGFKVRSGVAEGRDPASVILDEAERSRAHLIVLGARGLTPLKTFFLGSVSQKVSRHAGCSVLLVRGPQEGRAVAKVLVAVDGSLSSRKAVDFLLSMGLPVQSKITLVHVAVDPLMAWSPAWSVPGASYGAWEGGYQESAALLKKKGEDVLKRSRRTLEGHFPRVETTLVMGHGAGEILRLAAEKKVDLIVLGHRGLSALDRFVLGSTAHKVSAYAEASVLIVQ